MIKEALQYVVDSINTRVESIGERKFSTQPLHLIKEATPTSIEVRSLSGLVQYVKSNFDGDGKLMIHVESPTEVKAFSTFNRDFNRNFVIEAKAMIPRFRFDNWYDTEEINIKLQSCFVQNEHRDIMLKIVGNIQEENVSSIGDDGVSQAVVAKTGVASVSKVKVPNPVSLAPYRTFVEVDQPESDFVFRMRKGPSCALFEADGGAWELQAMRNIKSYLEEALNGELEAGQVVIIA